MDNMRPRTCRQCDTSFTGGPRAWYCPECRKKRGKIRAAEYRINGAVRRLGSTDTCRICSQPYTVASGRQQYCGNCSAEAVKKIDREQGLEWYHENSETYNPARYAARRKKKICVICGTEFPCNGTCRNTCSDECRKVQRREFQRKADKKRSKKGSKN